MRGHKQAKQARGDSVSGRIEFNGFDGGSHGDSTSGSAGAERRPGRARSPSISDAQDLSSSIHLISSGSSGFSLGGKKTRKGKPALERSLEQEFEDSTGCGGADGAPAVAEDLAQEGQPQEQGTGAAASDQSADVSMLHVGGEADCAVRLFCDLEESYPLSQYVVSEVVAHKEDMKSNEQGFLDRYLPGAGVRLTRNYRKAVEALKTRVKCGSKLAKVFLELSRAIRVEVEALFDEEGAMKVVPAHLGLAFIIAHLWNGLVTVPMADPVHPVIDESLLGGDESDVCSDPMPMMQDDDGNAMDLAGLNLKSDAAMQQKVMAFLTGEPLSAWMRKYDSSETLQTWVNDLAQLMDAHAAATGTGEKKTTSPPKAKPSGAAAAHVKKDASGGAMGKRRVQPSLVKDLGASYRVGAGLAAEDQFGVGALARRKKRLEHKIARVSAALSQPQTPGLLYSAPLLSLPTMNPDIWELTRTVEKVLQRRPDLASLPKAERMRKATRMASREMHKKEVQAIRDKQVKDGDDGDGGDSDSSKSKSSSSSGGESGSSGDESVGDTVKSGERRSHDEDDSTGSGGDSFVAHDSSSGSGGSDDERERDRRRRLKDRVGSMNSLGTPKKSRGSAAATAAAPGHPGLMLLGDDGLKLWRIGTAKFNQGLCWTSYLHHKQAFDNHKQHSGRYSDRTFKSIIHANLVPTVCAACGFERAKWGSLSDEKLILALEKVLRPSRSTDFAVELRELRLLKHGDEPLLARYEAFAEKFLYKCAEAEDAGKRIKWNVIKNAFSDAVRTETVLKHWMQEVKWSGVAKAHKRLLRKLRESRSIEQLFHKGRAHLGGRAHGRDEAEEEDGDAPARERPPPKRRIQVGGRAKGNAARKSQAAERSATGKFNNAAVQAGKSKPAPSKGDKGPKLRQWKYDKRGASWHTDADLYDCYDRPCNRPFCQRCRGHGHTAEYCRKPDDAPGLTREGYAQETAKGKAAIRAPPPERFVKNNNAKGQRSDRDRRDDRDDRNDDDGCGGDDDEHLEHRSRFNHQRGHARHDDRDSEEHSEEEVETRRSVTFNRGKGNAARGKRGRQCL